MGCPGGISKIQYTQVSMYAGFLGQFFLKVFLEIDCNGKKDRCAVFGCNNDCLLPEKYTLMVFFCPKSMRKY